MAARDGTQPHKAAGPGVLTVYVAPARSGQGPVSLVLPRPRPPVGMVRTIYVAGDPVSWVLPARFEPDLRGT